MMFELYGEVGSLKLSTYPIACIWIYSTQEHLWSNFLLYYAFLWNENLLETRSFFRDKSTIVV